MDIELYIYYIKIIKKCAEGGLFASDMKHNSDQQCTPSITIWVQFYDDEQLYMVYPNSPSISFHNKWRMESQLAQ